MIKKPEEEEIERKIYARRYLRKMLEDFICDLSLYEGDEIVEDFIDEWLEIYEDQSK